MAIQWDDEQPAGGIAWDEPQAPRQQPTAAEAFGRGAVQGATLGFGDELGAAGQAFLQYQSQFLPKSARELLGIENAGANGSPLDVYRQARGENRQLEQRAQEAAPLAYGAGELLGGAPVAGLAPGYAGAALMGAAGGLGGGEADLTRGDVAGAALETGAGGAMGAVGEGLGRGVGKVVSKVAKPVGNALRKFASERALSAGGTMKAGRKALQRAGGTDAAGQFLLNEDVVRPFRGVEGVAEKLAQVQDDAGKQIGDVLRKLEGTRKALQRGGQLPAGAGPAPLSGEALAGEIERELVQPLARKPGARNLMSAYQSEADAFRALGKKPMSFDEMAAQVRAYNDPAKFHAANPPQVAKAAQDVRQVLRTAQDRYLQQVADQADKVTGGGARFKQAVQTLRDQKQRYGLATKLGDQAFDRAAGWGANNMFGLPEIILAGAGAGAGYAAGGQEGALKGAALGLGSKLARTYGASVAAPLAQALSRGVTRAGAVAPQRLAQLARAEALRRTRPKKKE